MVKKLFDEYHALLNRLMNLLIILAFPAMTGLMMLSKNIVIIIAGEKYIQASTSLAIIAWAILFSLFSWIFFPIAFYFQLKEKSIF